MREYDLPVSRAATEGSEPASPAEALDRLADRELVVVTGKGGVGKSAVSATLGHRLARAGRRVVVVEVDPRESVHRMLGIPPSGGEVARAGPRLSLQNLRPRQVIDGIVREQLRVGPLVRRVLASPVYNEFAEGAPGLRELAVVAHTQRLLRAGADRDGPRFDQVILDAPATGHGVSLLAAPRLVSEVIAGGPIGRMARQLATLVGDASRCAIVVVTQAEEMPVEEALELATMLDQGLGRRPDLLVVNGLYPPMPGPETAAVALGGEDPLAFLWRERRSINERELARLAARWIGPRVELPLLPIDPGPEMIAALDRCFDLGAGEWAAEA